MTKYIGRHRPAPGRRRQDPNQGYIFDSWIALWGTIGVVTIIIIIEVFDIVGVEELQSWLTK